MGFVSARRPQELVINDANYEHLLSQWNNIEGLGRGYQPRDWTMQNGVSTPFNLPSIPRSDWPDLIEARERSGQLLSQLCDQAGLKSKNQQSTNYCWTNAVITAIETLRAANGLPYIPLSPASVAAPLKGFRNVGGWGSEALAYITENGVNAESDWPPNAIDRRYATPENRQKARLNIVTEWWELRDKSFDQLMTCLLVGTPVPIGLLWWGHEVCAMDPVMLGPNRFGVRIRNSWSDDWGDHGFAVLEESKATPDDAVAPRVVRVY